MTRRRWPLGIRVTTWTAPTGGRWIVFARQAWKLTLGWAPMIAAPRAWFRRDDDIGGRPGAGIRIGRASVSVLPIQTDAEAATSFVGRFTRRPPGPFWSSRRLAVTWFAVAVFAYVADMAALRVITGPERIAVLVVATPIVVVGLFLAVGNWTGWIRLS